MSSPQYFDDNDPKYMCCCGCMHTKTGVKVIAALGIVGIIFQVIGLFTTEGSVTSSAISIIINAAAVTFLLLAIGTEKRGYALPYLILMGLNILSVFAMVIIFIIAIGSIQVGIIIFVLVICSVSVLLSLWFLYVVYVFFGYLKDKRSQNENTGEVHSYA